MSEISNLIISGEYEDLVEYTRANPNKINVYENVSAFEGRVYPLDWALKAGNYLKYSHLLRMGAISEKTQPTPIEVLKRTIFEICHSYYCAGSMAGMEESIWNQLFDGQKVFFNDDAQMSLSDSEKEDLKNLVSICNFKSKNEFIEKLSE